MLTNSNLKKKCKAFWNKNKDKLLDVVLFGSAVKGKDAKEIDIGLVSSVLDRESELLVEELERELDKDYHITYVKIRDMFEEMNPVIFNMLHEGISLVSERKLAENLGAKSMVLYNYKLKGLTQTQKVKFFYALHGRNGEGFLKYVRGESLARGAVLIPIEHDLEFKDFLLSWKLGFERRRVFVD